MRLTTPTLFLIMIFGFIVIYVIHSREAVTNELAVPSHHEGSAITVRKTGFGKEGIERKKGNDGSGKQVLEDEDYIYTNSIP
ncbi:hypothetical protein L6164_025099 [Bauhinia variegata]|uniref:Uncharacterized protein n=1 Tax=Bauhinia variegata TaxID=167791 RepID=A0ACB9M159_BAUVA|nr:hypothetical protein L6164_025099 [Bauhinia variegata]